MRYRRFGNTDLEVSEICFGPMRFAAKEPADDQKSNAGQRALARALERGVNFIHSSYEYGTRWSLGQVLKDHPKRHDVHHIIKVPVPDFHDCGKFDASKFRLRVEEALKDLHAETIAVLQHLQRDDPNTDDQRIPDIGSVHEPMQEIFQKLKEEGKVGYLTTFPYSPGFAAEVSKSPAFSGMVAYYNAIEMEMAQYFDDMEQQGWGFFCIRPFMAGILTDRRAVRSQLPDDDRFQDEGWNAAYKRIGLLNELFGDVIGSWTQFAIKFALIHPIVTSLIVGLNTVEQVDNVLDVADGNYPDRSVFDKAFDVFRRCGLVAS